MKLNNIAPNQTEIITDDAVIFFSYRTPVAANVRGKFYKTKEYYSRTTTKHINFWLDGRIAEEKEQSFFDNLVG